MSAENRVPLNSSSPNAGRLEALKALFPEAFTEGKIDLNAFAQALGESVATGRERYGMNWAGKSDAIHALQSLSVGTLKPVREESVNFDTTENMIIEGDNLEVLKLLQKSYFGKVKMIYIDPPYNTGNEFIYPDNFREGLEDYLRYSGQKDANGNATTANKETNGRYHSKWLSMMYPRLFLAKNLLRDDGVIFISIDDHEVHNLSLLVSEIFGEENLLGAFVWKRRSGANDAQDNISVDHEYVIIARATPVYQFGGVKKDFENYKNPDNDPRGEWTSADLTCNKTALQRPNLYYPITDPQTGIVYQCSQNRVWVYERNRMERIINENKVIFPSSPNGTPQYKRHLEEVRSTTKPVSTWIESSTQPRSKIKEESLQEGITILQSGLNQQGTKEFRTLFETQVFDYPKPVSLIKNLIQQATTSDPVFDDIVLDFFAGSGTTAQAVLELNKEDGGNRKFILVQLPEKTKHTDFPTIAHVTRERVRRVIAKIDDTEAENKKLPAIEAPDRGFKAFRLSASNFKIWEDRGDLYSEAAIIEQLEMFAENLLPDATPENILFEILLKAGYDLNAPREALTIGKQTVYSIGDNQHLICLERDIERETLEGMIERKPKAVICLDEAFHHDDALLTNILLQMQDANIVFQTI